MNNADEISQALRRQILANDRKVSEERRMSTYHAHSMSIDLEMGGRYSKLHPTSVTGSTSGPVYPEQPETSPANQAALVGPEAPLGYDINAMDPVGEFHERGDAPPSEPGGDGGLRRKGWRRL
jgi:hypothetical protein